MPVATSTLDTIRTKIRRITRSPSTSQISDDQLDQYINTFIAYDFPENIRSFSLRDVFTFYTQPFVDSYSTDTTDPLSPLYNFKNKYIAVHPPLYMAGIQCFYTQKRDVFYGYYPQTNTISDTQLRGNGAIGPFVGTVFGYPLLQHSIIFTCPDTAGTSMILVDTPINNLTGNLTVPNSPVVLGTVNYVTGAFTFNFPNNTLANAPIYVEYIAYQTGKPIAMLYYANTFTIRPVPNNVYAIQLEVDVMPTQLLASGQSPDLEQWWQYIALGAAIKIFQDKLDMDSVALIMPEFQHQESLVLRTTLTQQANERTTTIYTQGKAYNLGGWGGTGWPY